VQSTPIVKDLVLVGGGHSHVEVIRRFAMRPLPGVRLTVVARDVHTTYSGMLPGLVAGHYSFDDTHIDLGPLVHRAGGRLYHDNAIAIDPEAKTVSCLNRPPISYDLLSLDIGSSQDTSVQGAAEFAIQVKPVSNFTLRWAEAEKRILASTTPQRVGFVGGGAGSIELLFAIRHRLLKLTAYANRKDIKLSFQLITASDRLLPGYNKRVQKKFEQLLRSAGVELNLCERVVKVQEGLVVSESGKSIDLDHLFWVTEASAPAWLNETGLKLNANGFILVRDTLQSVSHPNIFASGDIAAVVEYPRPKSGVFAVRQGPPLKENLCRSITGQPLRSFKPQRQSLSLISIGDRYAIGSRGPFTLGGRWVWRWKDWIDRRFMKKYRELPEMLSAATTETPIYSADITQHDLQTDPMRCGGCGSKIGDNVLRAALGTLKQRSYNDVIIGLDEPDDAAVIKSKPGTVLVQTVDSFRAFIDDPYVFGQISANHCLSDIFAMGATPQTALAIVTLPLASPKVMRNDLVQLMSGAIEVFDAVDTAVVGGHTNEGQELALGFAVNGYIDYELLKRKGGAQAGDRLILTKPLGTGVLFAGAMRGRAQSRWIEAALHAMRQSNAPAAQCIREHASNALTDVTGFGLFGHLLEMLRSTNNTATVALDRVALFDGARSLADEGILSSLQSTNLEIEGSIDASSIEQDNSIYSLCFDPQTSGGLLAAVPEPNAEACVSKLRELGYAQTADIGSVNHSSNTPSEMIIMLS